MINADTRLLVICPSRQRPDRLAVMLESFDETKSPGTEMVIYVALDDPELIRYQTLFKDRNVIYGKRRYLVEVLNYVSCDLHPSLSYYGEVNDDHIYHTKGWDKILIDRIVEKGKGWGIACGRDEINSNWFAYRHPSACVISGNMLRALGHFVFPQLHHAGTDDYLRDIAEGVDRLFYCPEAYVEHAHVVNQRAKIDENYCWVYSAEEFNYGMKTYNNWVKFERDAYLNKIRSAMCLESLTLTGGR